MTVEHGSAGGRREEQVREQVALEQTYLDGAHARRVELRDEAALRLADLGPGSAGDPTARARQARLRGRVRELELAEQGLIFGRVDLDDGAQHRIGRTGLPARDDEGDPVVVDWRAPVARAFYTATAVDRQGVRRRRHVRTDGPLVTGVDDDLLEESGDGLVGEASLLAALGQGRTGRMGTAVATLQREQDDIVRAPATGPLVVQGGPGTGKTVVALHRVAYLLFSSERIAERGVLVLGPNHTFLQYISQVLPALGETAVVSTTVDDLLPGLAVERAESRAVAEIKGREIWLEVVRRHVDSLLPSDGGLSLRFDGETHDIGAAQVERLLAAARTDTRSLREVRDRAVERVLDLLVDAVADRHAETLAAMEEGLEDILAGVDRSLARRDDRGVASGDTGVDVDGQLSDADVERLRERVTLDPDVRRQLLAWWPIPDLGAEFRRMTRDADHLRRVAPELDDAEIASVTGEPEGRSSSDIPLLDALRAALDASPRAAEQGEFLAERAADDPDWVYGHVVVDEAQELSPMQWAMVLRRAGGRSMTAVGDIDQVEAAHPHTTWDALLNPVLGNRWETSALTICYRTPREVMALTGPVLEAAGSSNVPPTAVRSSGVAPWARETQEAHLAACVVEAVAGLRDRHPDGSVGVVVPEQRRAALAATVARELGEGVPVLSATGAKGLEWDAVLVVDPDGISSEPRGWNGLYVALTRCTQELGQLLLRPRDSQD
ncbi:DNA helicase IV [Barrientosiimonas humi]|uniref:DNA helicase IV n=1 Tax=Barrientosiimonas humi TaxID=999931 RepID=A0A542X9P3_9MICO|nr:UvrD-helicase domain-containing protein [Barrientosiimonas humi]TQL32557.1 DNA helicase IV [Barrientosiimonas humi]CAG7572549.1 Helicase IV [Barrientosiimonas humi]